MKILITNDDGIHGKGLNPLIKQLNTNSNELKAVVPDRERSAISQAITLDSPIRMKRVRKDIYKIDGTPTDCIYLTVLGAVDFKPDIVISGINRGSNLGEDIIYSGTVAAAIEACLHDITAFAVSICERKGKIYYESAAKVAFDFLRTLSKLKIPKGIFFNINIPNLPYSRIKGTKITRLASRRYFDRLIKRKDPHGNPYFWLESNEVQWNDEKGTDYQEVKNGYVSITPLHLDLTAYNFRNELEKVINKR